jgi:hypothetical protein
MELVSGIVLIIILFGLLIFLTADNIQVTCTKVYTSPSGAVTVSDDIQTGDTVIEQSFNIPAQLVAGQININIPLTGMQAFALATAQVAGDQGVPGAVTVDTNTSTGTAGGDNQFVITTTNGIQWSAGDTEVNPVTHAITALYVTNPNSAQMVLNVRVLLITGIGNVP